jgi:putative transposase
MAYNPLIHHRRSIRLKGYDYSQAGAYFITICTKDRQHLFGKVLNEEMILNKMGQIAYNEWLKTPDLRPNVSLDVFAIMPNHMHGIIILNDNTADDTGGWHALHGKGELHSPNNYTGESHAPGLTEKEKGECDSPRQRQQQMPRSPSNNIGVIVRGYKSSVTKQINLLNYPGSAWQRDYYEHIIRNEQSYQRISDYILNNPAKWEQDKFYLK